MNSKRKGNRFELKAAKWFTKWSGYEFSRVPMSGGWHSNPNATSDITCIDKRHGYRCKISVECKSYKDIKFERLLLGNKSAEILKFWNQAEKDAKRGGKFPILCMRYNSMPKDEFFFVTKANIKGPTVWCSFKTSEIYLCIYLASDILKNLPYKDFHKQIKAFLKAE